MDPEPRGPKTYVSGFGSESATLPIYFVLLFQVDVYKEILSLEVRESEERPADDDNQLFRQVCDQLRYM
jgi:hypothetical protein